MEIKSLNNKVPLPLETRDGCDAYSPEPCKATTVVLKNLVNHKAVDLYDLDVEILSPDSAQDPLAKERTCTSPSHQRSYCACTQGGCPTANGCIRTAYCR